MKVFFFFFSCLSQQIQQYPKYSNQQETKVDILPQISSQKLNTFSLCCWIESPWNVVENTFMQEVCGRWGSWLPFSILPSIRNKRRCRIVPSFLLLRRQKWTEVNPVLDKTRESREGSERSAFTDYSRAKNGRPTAESCGETPARTLLARSVPKKTNKKIQVSQRKKQKTLAASSPASEAGGVSSRKKAEKGSVVLSDTLCYILCVSGEMHIRCCLSSLNMPLLLMRDQAG